MITTLKKRNDFLYIAKGDTLVRQAFVLKARARRQTQQKHAHPKVKQHPRFGFTVTKKIGNAVERNRIRRRFRALVYALQDEASAAYDYVLIGRRKALNFPFSKLEQDFSQALKKIHKQEQTQGRQ